MVSEETCTDEKSKARWMDCNGRFLVVESRQGKDWMERSGWICSGYVPFASTLVVVSDYFPCTLGTSLDALGWYSKIVRYRMLINRLFSCLATMLCT